MHMWHLYASVESGYFMNKAFNFRRTNQILQVLLTCKKWKMLGCKLYIFYNIMSAKSIWCEFCIWTSSTMRMYEEVYSIYVHVYRFVINMLNTQGKPLKNSWSVLRLETKLYIEACYYHCSWLGINIAVV